MNRPAISVWALGLIVSALAHAACSTSDAAKEIRWDGHAEPPSRGLQAPEAQELGEGPETGEHEERNKASIFLGDTIVHGDNAFTIGFDYEYRLQEHVGIGGLVDVV